MPIIDRIIMAKNKNKPMLILLETSISRTRKLMIAKNKINAENK